MSTQTQTFDTSKPLFFEDLETGMQAQSSQLVTDQTVTQFAAVSGDSNPVHLDDNYAATTPFKKRIAHGILSASYISAILANRLPGPGSIYVGQNLRFKAPVFLGDEVTTRVEIINLIPEKNFVEVKTQCHVGETLVLDGEATVLVPSQA